MSDNSKKIPAKNVLFQSMKLLDITFRLQVVQEIKGQEKSHIEKSRWDSTGQLPQSL